MDKLKDLTTNHSNKYLNMVLYNKYNIPYKLKRGDKKLLFKTKFQENRYIIYPRNQKTLYKRIKLNRGLTEEVNKVTSVVNKESVIQINNGLLGTLAFNCFFKQLESFVKFMNKELNKTKINFFLFEDNIN